MEKYMSIDVEQFDENCILELELNRLKKGFDIIEDFVFKKDKLLKTYENWFQGLWKFVSEFQVEVLQFIYEHETRNVHYDNAVKLAQDYFVFNEIESTKVYSTDNSQICENEIPYGGEQYGEVVSVESGKWLNPENPVTVERIKESSLNDESDNVEFCLEHVGAHNDALTSNKSGISKPADCSENVYVINNDVLTSNESGICKPTDCSESRYGYSYIEKFSTCEKMYEKSTRYEQCSTSSQSDGLKNVTLVEYDEKYDVYDDDKIQRSSCTSFDPKADYCKIQTLDSIEDDFINRLATNGTVLHEKENKNTEQVLWIQTKVKVKNGLEIDQPIQKDIDGHGRVESSYQNVENNELVFPSVKLKMNMNKNMDLNPVQSNSMGKSGLLVKHYPKTESNLMDNSNDQNEKCRYQIQNSSKKCQSCKFINPTTNLLTDKYDKVRSENLMIGIGETNLYGNNFDTLFDDLNITVGKVTCELNNKLGSKSWYYSIDSAIPNKYVDRRR